MVKAFAGKQRRELIVAIDDGGFTVTPDKRTTPVRVPYSEVKQAGPNLSTNAKIRTLVRAAAVPTGSMFLLWLG
jgi:hypothetical protein